MTPKLIVSVLQVTFPFVLLVALRSLVNRKFEKKGPTLTPYTYAQRVFTRERLLSLLGGMVLVHFGWQFLLPR